MANGYFERGEIYWVRMDNGFGGEQGVGRPGLIVTADSENNKQSTVTIAFMSTKYHAMQNYVPVEATGQTSYVICNQIMTYDKARLGKCLGVLNVEEQRLVDDALERLFDLGYVDDKALKEKDAEIAERNGVIGVLKTEMAGVKAEVSKRDEEIASLKMEIEMWQKCYGRCMDMLVDVKVSGDLARRTAAPAKVVDPEEPVLPLPEEPKKPEPPKQPEPPKPEEPKLVDINTATFNQLRGIGMSNNLILTLMNKRPFKKVEDLKNLPGLNAQKYNIFAKKICCVPVAQPKSAPVEEDLGYEVVEEPVVIEEPKVEVTEEVAETPAAEVRTVNINAATAEEISEITGIHISTCRSITGYRKKNGPYAKPEDLLNVHHFYPGTLEKCRGKIECGEFVVRKPVEKPEVKVVTGGKVNINTASAQEISDATGINKTQCSNIVCYRKKNGPFSSIDDLLKVRNIYPGTINPRRHLLEI